MPVIAGLAATLCFLVAALGYRQVVLGPDMGTRGDELDGKRVRGPRRSLVAGIYTWLGRWAGPWLGEALGPRWRRHVADLLAAAGQPRGYDVQGFAQLQGAYAVLATVVGAAMMLQSSPFMSLLLVGLLLGYPEYWLIVQAQRRQRQIERDLPDFLDILAVTVSAGLSFRQSLDRVSETLTGPLAEELRRALRRMDVGVRRRVAFVELRDRNPRSATMGMFTTAILQAEELGAPLTETLNQLARDMRREFAQQSRRRAARAIPRVSLIITMVIMPALVVLLMVALFLGTNVDLSGL